MRKILVFFIILVLFSSGCVQKDKGGEKMDLADSLAGKKIAMVVAPKNFRDEELQEPRQIFEDLGASVTIASKNTDSATGMMGAVVTVDKNISDLKVGNYDAVIFIGGSGASTYFEDERALELAKRAREQDKVLGAICIAPSILANAGLLEDKDVTSFPSERENLEQHGANYTDSNVEVDGKIVTGKGPEVASDFGQKVAEVLAQE